MSINTGGTTIFNDITEVTIYFNKAFNEQYRGTLTPEANYASNPRYPDISPIVAFYPTAIGMDDDNMNDICPDNKADITTKYETMAPSSSAPFESDSDNF